MALWVEVEVGVATAGPSLRTWVPVWCHLRAPLWVTPRPSGEALTPWRHRESLICGVCFDVTFVVVVLIPFLFFVIFCFYTFFVFCIFVVFIPFLYFCCYYIFFIFLLFLYLFYYICCFIYCCFLYFLYTVEAEGEMRLLFIYLFTYLFSVLVFF